MESCVTINSISSEEIANSVDLLTLILVRVPAKSLIRFKCVSKHWLSLISDSKFSNNHSRKSLKHSVSVLYIDSYPLINFNTKSIYPRSSLPKLDFLTTSSGVKPTILHSCNGLMLCSRGRETMVCNLTTQKFKVIPSFSCHPGLNFKFLSCDPISSPHYKVVSIGISAFDQMEFCIYYYYISIYSSETGMWKKLNLNGPQLELFTSMVHCDGAIYWMNEKNNLSWFDIDGENFKTIQISIEPVLFLDDYTFYYFGESDGHLFLILTRMPNEPVYQIFEMDMNNFRWTLKYDLNVRESIDTVYEKETIGDASYNKYVMLKLKKYHKQCSQSCVSVLYFKGGDEEEDHTLFLKYGRKIIAYFPRNNCWEIIPDLPDELYENMGRAHNFIESMASV